MPTLSHPCFDDSARLRASRLHLPVAESCNIQCAYCNRRFDCPNESRPGVTSTLLTPEQAAYYVDQVRKEDPRLAVVGIAGPGDPLASARASLHTLELVKARHPDLLLCLATNGLNLPRHADALVRLRVSHVTVTVNAIDPKIGARIVKYLVDQGRRLEGMEGATRLWAAQREGIRRLSEAGITVKVNSILIPGVNQNHIPLVAEAVALLGASRFNCIPLLPVEGTDFAGVAAPSTEVLHAVRAAASEHLPQMTHCMRCRADAAGRLGEKTSNRIWELLEEAARSDGTTAAWGDGATAAWGDGATAAPVGAATEELSPPGNSPRLVIVADAKPVSHPCRLPTREAPTPIAATDGTLDSSDQSRVVPLRSLSTGLARPYVASVSEEGVLVNQHLGEAEEFWVFEHRGDGHVLVERRPAPEQGGGPDRWRQVAKTLADCKALLVNNAGDIPKEILGEAGVEVFVTDGLIEVALDALADGKIPTPVRTQPFRCGKGSGCRGQGLLCG